MHLTHRLSMIDTMSRHRAPMIEVPLDSRVFPLPFADAFHLIFKFGCSFLLTTGQIRQVQCKALFVLYLIRYIIM